MSKTDSQGFDRARDELFSHINRCGVLRASADQQVEWMDDTMQFMAERFPDLSEEQLGELRNIGIRFCQPVIERAPTPEEDAEPSDDSADATSAAA